MVQQYPCKHVFFLSHPAVLNLVNVRVFNMTHFSQRIVVPFTALRLIARYAINPKSSDAGDGPLPKDSFLGYQSRCAPLSLSPKSGCLISLQFCIPASAVCLSTAITHEHCQLQLLQTPSHFPHPKAKHKIPATFHHV